MQKHTTIPTHDGLYWYYETGADAPRPVLINEAKHAGRFKSFNGAEQPWLRDGEYLLGPVPMPEGKVAAEKFEAVRAWVIALLDGDDIRQHDSFEAFFDEIDTTTHYEQEDCEDSLELDRDVLEAVYLDLFREAEADEIAKRDDLGRQVQHTGPWLRSAPDELSRVVECADGDETTRIILRVRFAHGGTDFVEAVAIDQRTGRRVGRLHA